MANTRVMIVDDDRDFLEELQDALTSHGYETIPISRSTIAPFAAYTTKPDVILLDIKMDGMSGFDVAEHIKRFSSTADIPIIAMTGFFNKEKHLALMDLCGMKICLEKPFNPRDVIATIEGVLQGST
ncbi:MAG: response regulator [bacterium]